MMQAETQEQAVEDGESTTSRSRLRSPPSTLTREQLISILSPIAFLLLWELSVQTGLLTETFFPAPTTVAGHFGELVQDGQLTENTVVTLRRFVGAFLLAAIPGIALGLVMGLSKTIRAILNPLVSILYPIPKIALLPLVIIIFGFGDLSIIFTASITAFFVILLNTMAGVLEIDDVLLEAAENFGATGIKKFYKVVLPGSLPLIFTGLRLGAGLALIVTIAAEFIASETGLGYFITHSWSLLQVTNMYCGFVVVGVIGWVSTAAIERIGDYLMPWREDTQVVR